MRRGGARRGAQRKRQEIDRMRICCRIERGRERENAKERTQREERGRREGGRAKVKVAAAAAAVEKGARDF